jgi:hypothetical protein
LFPTPMSDATNRGQVLAAAAEKLVELRRFL